MTTGYRASSLPLLPLLGAALFGLTGCFDWKGGATSEGAAGATTTTTTDAVVSTLTESELATLCDNYASRVGGYGPQTCTDGSTVNRTSGSQAQCVQNSQDSNTECMSTVSAWGSCATLLQEADPCDGSSLQAAQTSASCTAYYASGTCSNIN